MTAPHAEIATLVAEPLRSWLGTITRDAFASQHLQRFPVAQPHSARTACALLDDAVLTRVLGARDPGPDVLVVARGRLLPLAPPRDLDELRRYAARGIGLCVRHAERCDPGLAALAQSFAWLGTPQIQLFVTPGGTYGFTWHYDDEDVFIVQTSGVKHYWMRANTVAQESPSRAAFAKLPRETSPPCDAILVPGDFLYVPRRWWHRAFCREDARSISIGVLPPAPAE